MSAQNHRHSVELELWGDQVRHKEMAIMDLEPCPFCGSAGAVFERRSPFGEDLADNIGHIAWAECCECGCKTRQILHYNTSEMVKSSLEQESAMEEKIIKLLFSTRFSNNLCITILVLSGLYIISQVVRAIFF